MAAPSSRSIPLRRSLLGGAAALVVGVAALAAAAGDVVEVRADGGRHEVRLLTGTVADALVAAEITLGPGDVVTPDAGTPVEEAPVVVVTRAIDVEVVVDDQPPVTVTAPVRSVAGVLHHAGLAHLRQDGAVLTPGWRQPVADGDRITVRRPATVVLEVDGTEQQVVSLAAEVDDLLRLQDVELGPDDVVWPLPDTELRDDQTIVVHRVELRTETEELILDHAEVRRETDELERGTTRVEVEGRDGLQVDTYLVRLVDGVEVERERIEREVVTEPVDRVVLVGTFVPPPPPPPPSSSARTTPSGVPGLDDPVWTRLAACESNNNWQLVSANGLYYGGLQFHPQTWRSVGGTGMPNQASREEQIRRAQILLSQPWATWGNQWPACSRRLGLS
jgi:uncharacterized protein YabE (DUF348 family)